MLRQTISNIKEGWNTKLNKRPGNAGDRIDYVLASSDMRQWFCEANIQEGLMVCWPNLVSLQH